MKYLIVGSGPAGLSLAYALALNNYDIEIIEESDQLGGSWNSQWIDNKYFSENSPRVYTDTGNSKILLEHLGFTEKDFQNIYGNFFQTNYKIVSLFLKHFNLFDYFLFLFGFIKYTFYLENITVFDWLSKTYFSCKGKKAIKILCILICDRPDKTNINDFFGFITGSSGGSLLKQMKEPNKWHEVIEDYLKSKDNIIIVKNTRVEKIQKTGEIFSIYSKNIKYGYHSISYANKVFLCTQSNGIFPILKNSDDDIKNNWMPIDKMQLWNNNTYYSSFGFQLHFDKLVHFKDEWCWSCMGDWTVIILPVSNWLKRFSKDQSIKTVWSCCIVDMDTKSKRINKTANQCSYNEVIDECLFQINQLYTIPFPKIITTSLGLKNIDNKWISKNTGYTKNTFNDLNVKGKVDNLFSLGCFTDINTNQIAYMGGAIDATANYLKKYENLKINIFN